MLAILLQFDPQIMLTSALKWIGIFALLMVLLYVYFGVMLTLIAHKSNTRNGWLAWLPIGNLFLLCMIARRPLWWVILMLIPFVNLIIFGIIWMSIAEVRGKPSWTGALIVLPVLGLAVPFYLALGRDTNPDAVETPRICPNCNRPAEGGDTFCGDCGYAMPALPTMPAMAMKRTPVWQMALVSTLFIALAAGLTVGATFLGINPDIAYTPPKRQKPVLPKRTEGTLKEFPVDTDANSPATPTSVITQNYGDKNNLPKLGIPPAWLPPGVKGEKMPTRVNTITSAAYKAKNVIVKKPAQPKPPPRLPSGGGDTLPTSDTASAGFDDLIYVHVMETAQPRVGEEVAIEVIENTNGQKTGVSVENPNGNTYTGTRIHTPLIDVYVLNKQGSNIVILIYAPVPELQETAARLAKNVGNGEGLNDYPEVQNSLWTLPQQPPSELELQEVNTLTSDDIIRQLREIEIAVAGGYIPEVEQMIKESRDFIPSRITIARYNDRQQRDWNLMVGDFNSITRASTTWLLLKWATTAGGELKPITIDGYDGLYTDQGSDRLIFYKRGPYIIILNGPSSQPLDRMTDFIDKMQV